jgi:hypothetical protein
VFYGSPLTLPVLSLVIEVLFLSLMLYSLMFTALVHSSDRMSGTITKREDM